jgi:hypothetical protein
MYSGTTFRNKSGSIVGVHQKIDRIARRHLKKHIPAGFVFPTSAQILHFEGNNGPDGIKRKSPSRDEPWHYIDPTKPDDMILVNLINDHVHNLTAALSSDNHERAAFEAAWLAHAVVDGLTPAHHYPLSDKIEELWGKPHHERTTIKDKSMIKGVNRRDTLAKNWEYWGVGGVFTAHIAFEWGVASTIAPLKFSDINLTQSDVDQVIRDGLQAVFMQAVARIDAYKLYDQFDKSGWTRDMVKLTRNVLVPEIIKTVTLAWYSAAYNTGKLS